MNMNDVIRKAAGYGPQEAEPELTQTPSFDGGTRTPAPPVPPSMSETLHAALLTAKHHLPPDEALRQVQSERR